MADVGSRFNRDPENYGFIEDDKLRDIGSLMVTGLDRDGYDVKPETPEPMNSELVELLGALGTANQIGYDGNENDGGDPELLRKPQVEMPPGTVATA